MKFITAAAAFAILTSVALGDEAKYSLAATNTAIEWTGKKVGGQHKGGFKKLKGVAVVGDEGLVEVSVDIDTNSLNSDTPKLTQHLKSPDFFAVKDHPSAKFKSTKIEKGDKDYIVTGDLTLLGKTKEITFPAEINTDGKFALKADLKINRSDYGMNFKKGEIDDEVSIRLKVDAKPQKSSKK